MYVGIVVIRRPREATDSKTGLGRYADSVEELLDEFGVDHDVIEASLDLKHGIVRAVMDGLIRPFIRVLRVCRDRSEVVHAADELCGLFFPFVRGRRVLTVHHVIGKTEGRGGLYFRFWFLMTRIAVKHSDDIIAISPDSAKDLVETFHPSAKVHVVYNSISDLYRRDDSISREKLIGVVAELIPRKNVAESVEAFRILSGMEGMQNYKMIICGKGPEKERLLKQIADWNLSDKIEIVDSLEDEELLRLYNRMALLFNTSLHEGTGMVSLEANRCGTPALCLKRANIPLEVTAASVKCADAEEMAKGAYKLLTDLGYYAEVSENSVLVAQSFGEGFSESMRSLYGLF